MLDGMEGLGFLIVATVAVLLLLTLGIMCNQRRFTSCIRIKHKTTPQPDHPEARLYPTVEYSYTDRSGFYRPTRPPSYQNHPDPLHQPLPSSFIVNVQVNSADNATTTVLSPPPPAYKDHYRDTLLHPTLATPEPSS